MAGVAFAVEGDGVGFATESYAASAFYTTLASLSGVLWRIRWASILYLFGRGQDIGFQKAIDNSPRKRHHIRFWALKSNACPGHLGSSGLLAEYQTPAG